MKLNIVAAFALLALATQAQANSEQQYVQECLALKGIQSSRAVCWGETQKDQQLLSSIGFHQGLEVDFSKASFGTQGPEHDLSFTSIAVPVKGSLFWKKYLTLECREDGSGNLRAGDFKVDIEDRVDVKITATVQCN